MRNSAGGHEQLLATEWQKMGKRSFKTLIKEIAKVTHKQLYCEP